MKNKIDHWTAEIDLITAAFKSNFEHLDPSDLNKKADAKSWSIAQNIHHLIVINQTYFPVIENIRSGNYKLGFVSKIGFLTRFFGKMILSSVQADRKKKIKTFPIWEPSKSALNTDILLEFVQHQEELKKLISSSEDLLLKETLIASPANKNIIYKLEDAFDIIVTHEKRHLEQAKEMLEKLT